MTPKPNFFIVGAPKCGTTALSEYLRGNTHIFVSRPKEPHFFAPDFPRHQYVTTMENYLRLFQQADYRHTAIGEASVWYLYSADALHLIRRFNPKARIIVLLRNPCDMLISLHVQLFYNYDEDVRDFRAAWALQEERGRGRNLPRHCRQSAMLQYRDVGMLGRQVDRLLKIFPRDQIKLVLFDDFVQDTPKIYQDILEFLQVPPDHRTSFPKINERRDNRWPWLGKMIQNPPFGLQKSVRLLRLRVGIDVGGLAAGVRKLNAKRAADANISHDFRLELRDIFADDILLLEQLLNRSLRRWLR